MSCATDWVSATPGESVVPLGAAPRDRFRKKAV
jgi:hypothetical protein